MPLLLAATALAAGCTGGSDGSANPEDYAGEMRAIQQDPGGETRALGDAMADPRLEDRRWRRATDLWLAEQHRALQGLNRIAPPSEVSSLHARYVAETERWLGEMENLVASVRRGETPRRQLGRRATELGDRYAARVGPIASEIEAEGYDAFPPFGSST